MLVVLNCNAKPETGEVIDPSGCTRAVSMPRTLVGEVIRITEEHQADVFDVRVTLKGRPEMNEPDRILVSMYGKGCHPRTYEQASADLYGILGQQGKENSSCWSITRDVTIVGSVTTAMSRRVVEGAPWRVVVSVEIPKMGMPKCSPMVIVDERYPTFDLGQKRMNEIIGRN